MKILNSIEMNFDFYYISFFNDDTLLDKYQYEMNSYKY